MIFINELLSRNKRYGPYVAKAPITPKSLTEYETISIDQGVGDSAFYLKCRHYFSIISDYFIFYTL